EDNDSRKRGSVKAIGFLNFMGVSLWQQYRKRAPAGARDFVLSDHRSMAARTAGMIRNVGALRDIRALRMVRVNRAFRPVRRGDSVAASPVVRTSLRVVGLRSTDHATELEAEGIRDLAPAFALRTQRQHALHGLGAAVGQRDRTAVECGFDFGG